jgi:hypothetical protein
MTDPPSQTHSDTSVGSARSLSRKRVLSQERWVYETLQRLGKADWELWEMVKLIGIFDKISSLRRARIGLLWPNRRLGATPWHPVEDSGKRNKDPFSNKSTVIWKIKDRYKDMSYEQWAREYRNLAKGLVDVDT